MTLLLDQKDSSLAPGSSDASHTGSKS